MFRLYADYLQRSAEVEVSDSLDTDSDVDVAMVDDMLSATEDDLPSVDDSAGYLPSVDDDGASAADVDLVDELLSVEDDLLDDVLLVDEVASAGDVDDLRSLATAEPASASVVDATTVDLLSVNVAAVDRVENLPSIGTVEVCCSHVRSAPDAHALDRTAPSL